MAAKTSWHRYGTKLRHCHPVYSMFMYAVEQLQPVLSGDRTKPKNKKSRGEKKQEVLLPQTDRATRYVSQNIVNTVETSCITNPQQIAVMELEGYSWSTCRKQPRLVDCSVGVVNKLDR